MIIESTKPILLTAGTRCPTEVPVLGIDPSLQIRVAINQATVGEYAERMKAGDQFPPIVVFSVGTSLLLADGFHRHLAAQKAGMVALAVIVHHGTRKDAIAYAIKSNSTHGLARSNADKRRAVCLALQEFADRSDRVIAAMCKTSQPFVGSVRRGMKTVISSGKRVGRDGKQRSMPTRNASRILSSGQVTQFGSMTESEATVDQRGQGNAEFCVDEAWSRIERLLSLELGAWPSSKKLHLRDQLQNFMHRNFS